MEQQLQQERIVIENDDEIEIDLKDLVLESFLSGNGCCLH